MTCYDRWGVDIYIDTKCANPRLKFLKLGDPTPAVLCHLKRPRLHKTQNWERSSTLYTVNWELNPGLLNIYNCPWEDIHVGGPYINICNQMNTMWVGWR